MSLFNKKSIFWEISRIYFSALEVALLFSSFFLSGFALFIFLRFININIKILYILLILVIPFYILDIARETKNENIKKIVNKIINYSMESLKIFASIFILFLFLNSYLIFSYDLNVIFTNTLDILDIFDKFVNRLAIGIFFSIILIVFGFYFILVVISFVINKIKNNTIAKIVRLFFIITLVFLIISVLNESFFNNFSDFFYNKFNWLLGFSLIYLHLNYLIKKIASKKTVI